MDAITLVRRCCVGGPPGVRWTAGFSLMELIAVIAVMSIIAVISIPFLAGTIRGAGLNRAGQLVVSEMAFARQEAVTRNCDVEVRFYEMIGGNAPVWSAMQLWQVKTTSDGVQAVPFGRMESLPEGFVLVTRDNLSPLITEAPLSGTLEIPGRGTVTWRGFRFRPSGSPEILNGESNFVTLANRADTKNPPADYYTVQINALTGRAAVFRP